MDVLIFGGQSNMCGTTSIFPKDIFELDGAYEYKYNNNKVTPLKHPCGEDINEDLLEAASSGCMIPDFVRAYRLMRNVKIMTVHVSKGRTRICDWEKNSDRYEVAKEKILLAINEARKIEKVEHVYYIWLQGESDATHSTSEQEYYSRLIDYKNNLKKDTGVEKFGIIRVGHFSKQDECDQAIQRAQEKCVKEDKDFLMLTRVCEFLSKDEFFMNPTHKGHYENNALAIIGNCAGEYLGRYAVNEIIKGEYND